jgi:hypothetical protein
MTLAAIIAWTALGSAQGAPVPGIPIAFTVKEVMMPDNELDDLIPVPIPASETQAEHDRIRSSNDRDQKLEREGKKSRHNQGYDEAADGPAVPRIERVVDE